jgi:glycosyltransferase involved in cell wall biosynthesis
MSGLVFVTPTFGRDTGGLGVSAERITRGLVQRVPLSVLQPDRSLPRERFEERGKDECGRRRIAFWHGSGPEGGQFLADVIEHLRPTRVAAFGSGDLAQPAVFAARMIGADSYVFCRGNDIDLGLFSREAHLIYWALEHCDQIFAVSTEMERKVHAVAPLARVTYVPNGVDGSIFTPKEGGKPRKPLRVGLFGEIKRKKGLEFLLEALDFTRFSLSIQGYLREDAQKLLHGFLTLRPELAASIDIRPYDVDPRNVARRYHEVDIVVLPSVHDGMANALLEAMASGKVCVATAVGGVADLLKDGENGFVCPPRSVADLAQALDRAAAASAKEVGRAARATALEIGSPERELETYARLMEL